MFPKSGFENQSNLSTTSKMMTMMRNVLQLAFLFRIIAAEDSYVTKATPLGVFYGKSQTIHSFEVHAFRGIPYAEVPIHLRRFKKVSKSKFNQSMRYEKYSSPNCPQNVTAFNSNRQDNWRLETVPQEDCLYMNIWQPKAKEDTLFPVAVWIHAGDFNSGSSAIKMFDGTNFAARTGVVVVSFQYRLGAIGFLSTGDNFAPGNAGLKDQVLALKWIRENIVHFHGDKDKVTVIGHSAGSSSVGYHLLSPDTSKLFRRAILLSGVPNTAVAFVSSEEAKRRSLKLQSKLLAQKSYYGEERDILLVSHWQDIVKAQSEVVDAGSLLEYPFLPTIDSSIVPEHPITMLEKAEHLKDKEVIVSWTKDEGSVLLASQLKITSHVPPDVSQKQFESFFQTLAKGDQNLTMSLMNLYGAGGASRLQKLIDAAGDYYFKCPTNQFVDQLRKHGASVYQLEFSHRSNSWPEWMGVAQGHDLEMFFWNAQDNRGMREGTGVQKTYHSLISDFIFGVQMGFEGKKLRKDDISVISSNPNERPNRRLKFCKALEDIVPNYTSGFSRKFRISTLVLFITSQYFFRC